MVRHLSQTAVYTVYVCICVFVLVVGLSGVCVENILLQIQVLCDFRRVTLSVLAICTVRLRGMGTGISEVSKRVPILPFATQGGKQVSSYFRQGNWVQARDAQIRFPAGWLEFDSIKWSSCARQRASYTIFRYLWLTIPTRRLEIRTRLYTVQGR